MHSYSSISHRGDTDAAFTGGTKYICRLRQPGGDDRQRLASRILPASVLAFNKCPPIAKDVWKRVEDTVTTKYLPKKSFDPAHSSSRQMSGLSARHVARR
jgi:hypothetical protein